MLLIETSSVLGCCIFYQTQTVCSQRLRKALLVPSDDEDTNTQTSKPAQPQTWDRKSPGISKKLVASLCEALILQVFCQRRHTKELKSADYWGRNVNSRAREASINNICIKMPRIHSSVLWKALITDSPVPRSFLKVIPDKLLLSLLRYQLNAKSLFKIISASSIVLCFISIINQ